MLFCGLLLACHRLDLIQLPYCLKTLAAIPGLVPGKAEGCEPCGKDQEGEGREEWGGVLL